MGTTNGLSLFGPKSNVWWTACPLWCWSNVTWKVKGFPHRIARVVYILSFVSGVYSPFWWSLPSLYHVIIISADCEIRIEEFAQSLILSFFSFAYLELVWTHCRSVISLSKFVTCSRDSHTICDVMQFVAFSVMPRSVSQSILGPS